MSFACICICCASMVTILIVCGQKFFSDLTVVIDVNLNYLFNHFLCGQTDNIRAFCEKYFEMPLKLLREHSRDNIPNSMGQTISTFRYDVDGDCPNRSSFHKRPSQLKVGLGR